MSGKALYWVGIDVSGADFDAAVASAGQAASAQAVRQLPARTFSRNASGVKEFVRWLGELLPEADTLPARAVMEATGIFSIQLAALLAKYCPELGAAIANPQQTSAFCESLGLRNKTDRMDARALAFFGVSRQPKPYEPLSPNRAELRSLSRCRAAFVKERVAHQAQLRQSPESALSRKLYAQVIDKINKSIEKLEKDMLRVIGAAPELERDYALLRTIKGVGMVTAATILAEFGDLRQFDSGRQVAAHAGVTASHNDSGTLQPPAHMSKKGNARVRQALYMASLSAIVHNPHMHEVYKRLVGNGKENKVALGAVMRKLIVLMRAIVVSGRPYNPQWKTQWKNTPRQQASAAKTP